MSETVLDPSPVHDLLGGHAPSPRLAPAPSRSATRARHAAPVYMPPTAVRRNRLTLLIGVAAITYLLDVVTKVAVVALLQEDDPVEVGGLGVSLRLIRNPGAAFGLGWT